MESSEPRYAKTIDGTHIAYAVMGDGPIDLVYAFGYLSNIDADAEVPFHAAFRRRLASFSRLIVFDRRGTGAMGEPRPREVVRGLPVGPDGRRVGRAPQGSGANVGVGHVCGERDARRCPRDTDGSRDHRKGYSDVSRRGEPRIRRRDLPD